jgi:hypothetical protein
MRACGAVLSEAGARVRLIRWSDAPPKGDAVDLVGRHGHEDARALVAELIAAALDEGAGTSKDDDGDAPPHPWDPITDWSAALEPPPPPAILRAEGGGALLYEGARHVLGGEYESGKSWIAAAAAVELIQQGRDVWWLDADRMGQRALFERLTAFGATLAEIGAHVLYVAPDLPADAETRKRIAALIASRDIALAVIDAFDPALELQGLDPNLTRDVQRFHREVVNTFTDAGIATLLPDHVAKDPDKRGKYSIGSQRKATAADVLIVAELVGEKITRTSPRGKIVLRALKDRPGWHDRGPGQRIGEFVLDLPSAKPWRLVLDRGSDAQGDAPFRPTVLMERVSRWLEPRMEPASRKAIEDNVPGRGQYVRQAIDMLDPEGFIRHQAGTGRGGGTAYESVKPYREADDTGGAPPPDDWRPDLPTDIDPDGWLTGGEG